MPSQILIINVKVFKICPLRLTKLCLINGLFINPLTQTLKKLFYPAYEHHPFCYHIISVYKLHSHFSFSSECRTLKNDRMLMRKWTTYHQHPFASKNGTTAKHNIKSCSLHTFVDICDSESSKSATSINRCSFKHGNAVYFSGWHGNNGQIITW